MKRLPPDNQEELKREWTEFFERYDADGNGSLDLEEIQKVLDDVHLPTTRSQLHALFRCMDLDGDGQVDLQEFLIFASKRRKALRRAFESIMMEGGDGSDNGGEAILTAAHLRRASQKAGLALSDRDVRDIMKRVQDGSGGKDKKVSFEEFVRYSMLIPHVNAHAFFDQWFSEFVVDDSIGGYTVARELKRDEGESLGSAALRKLSCGGAAGVVSRTLTAPLDRIRLLMMTSVTQMSISQAYQQAVISTGARGLWLGNGVNCCKICPEMAIKLFAFDVLRQKVAADPGNVSPGERFVAGGCAGALAEISVYPMEVMRTRMATGLYSSLGDCMASMSARAFYAGVGPSVAGIIPYAAIDLTVNSMLRDKAAEFIEAQDKEVSVPLLLSCGMASSAIATVATFPLNVVRTVAQATAKPVHEILASLSNEGVRGFYRGLLPCLVKVMPATSISYASYEWLNKRWSQDYDK